MGREEPPPPPPAEEQQLGRFGLSSTPRLRTLLEDVAAHPSAAPDLKRLCREHKGADTLPWRLVQQAWAELRRLDGAAAGSRAKQQQQQRRQQLPLLDGASLVLPSPPERQRSDALRRRLAQLQYAEDARRYAHMVADVTRHEREAAEAVADPFFPTTKLQLSFGLHVLATMGAFAALGYYGCRMLAPRSGETWAALSSAVGLAAGLLLETVLLIIRTNMPEPLERRYAHLLDKQTWERPAGGGGGRPEGTAPSKGGARRRDGDGGGGGGGGGRAKRE